MPSYKVFDCLEHELSQQEARLAHDGFKLTTKTSEKSLLPREYLKRSFSGDAASFIGTTKWTVICRTE